MNGDFPRHISFLCLFWVKHRRTVIEKSLYTLNQEYLGMSTVVRAALFVRESDKNLKGSPTMESQVEDGRRYCQLKGYKLLEVNIYREAESAFYLPYHKRE